MAVLIEMPRLTDTMEEGVLAHWHIAEGDQVRRGQVIADIETDKATMEFESFEAGYVLKLLASEGETLALGAPIAVFGEKGEDPNKVLQDAPKQAKASKKMPESEEEPQEEQVVEEEVEEEQEEREEEQEEDEGRDDKPRKEQLQQTEQKERIPASPLARRMAREHDLQLRDVKGSGPRGRIVKSDIERTLSTGKTLAKKPGTPSKEQVDEFGRPYVDVSDRTIKLSQMRKTIVKRMGQSKREAPHIYLTMPIFMDKAAELRSQFNQAVDGYKISFNDLVVKAVSKALRKHPRINACYTPEGIIEYGNVHIGIAVALEDGLVVPVLRYADQKNLSTLSQEIATLGKRARARELDPQEMSGSTFTVSNLGMFGIEEFMAVINPGEGGILAVGAIQDEVVAVDGAMVIRKRMRVTLCSDHRVFDGADNAQFLVTLKEILEEPMRLFT